MLYKTQTCKESRVALLERRTWGWRLLAYALLFSLPSCKSCKKEVNPDPLPPETQTSANTFGCLIDGKPYIPDGSGGFGGAKPVTGGYLTNYCNGRELQVWIRTYRKDGWDFSIYLENVGNKTGKYPLKYTTPGAPTVVCPPNHAIFYKYISPSETAVYATDSEYTGEVTITRADTVNKIVSGTFFFKARRPATGEIIEITNGRFDVQNQ
ncbi:DUF6252 family protein [Raineya orbicola]|jgi:hypothetical protein|uniref:Uncharacterized protein n=1 Tax=Raineya orbicola TaxID=2016530 RepID=A0A2N3I913_9BACT|nr:DUF6252 family protein [Raineya orbicola]PKQ66733.1 hypothetical protein Rain11_2301 [Raineya orbicola]